MSEHLPSSTQSNAPHTQTDTYARPFKTEINKAQLTSDGRHSQTRHPDNPAAEQTVLPPVCACFSQHPAPRPRILFGSKRWSSQAIIMSAVIDLRSARYRPLVCVAVALETGSPARATLFRLEDVMAFFFLSTKPASCTYSRLM